MSDKDQMVMLSLNECHDLPERLWAYDDFTAAEDRLADLGTGLVNLGFIGAAIRRGAWFLCVAALAGLLAGFGSHVAFPPSYQASTSLLLTHAPDSLPSSAMADDQAIAQSRAVAGHAMHKLGLRQSVSSFLAAYTVTVVSDRVLLITVNAPSSSDAVSRANAVATEFLRFRADQLETEQKLMLRSLDQQIGQTRQQINSISEHISKLSAQPVSLAQQAQLSSLRTERSQAATSLSVLEQTTIANQASTQAATTSQVEGSDVLDPATPIPHSQLKPLVLYAAIGLLVGLALSVGTVVVRALVSDRLRQRDDVARALGAPVRLSVGTVRLSRWLPGRRRLTAAEVQLTVAHLRNVMPRSSRGAATLAVVPVDDPRVAAMSLVSLAVSCAQEGKQVVVADLCTGAPAAMLLGAENPGVREVSVSDAHLIVAVPDRDDVLPVGPLDRASAQSQRSPLTQAVAGACASADMLLTLATLDPSLGGEHLATWATAAVAVVTAGRSSATRVHAVGEMIRLAGIPLGSAVLIGADKSDESLGVAPASGADGDAEIREEDFHSDARDIFVAVDGDSGGGPSDDR